MLVYYQKSEVAAEPRLRGAIQAGVPLSRPGGKAQREQGVCYPAINNREIYCCVAVVLEPYREHKATHAVINKAHQSDETCAQT